MKSRYDRAPGKDAKMSNLREERFQGQHKANNAFVKAEQAKIKANGGKDPKMQDKFMEFNANMMNNGMHAQELARTLTKGIDHEAFPVK